MKVFRYSASDSILNKPMKLMKL